MPEILVTWAGPCVAVLIFSSMLAMGLSLTIARIASSLKNVVIVVGTVE